MATETKPFPLGSRTFFWGGMGFGMAGLVGMGTVFFFVPYGIRIGIWIFRPMIAEAEGKEKISTNTPFAPPTPTVFFLPLFRVHDSLFLGGG